MKEVPSQDPNREEKFAHRYIIGNLQHTKTDYCQHSYASNALTVQRIPPATLQQQNSSQQRECTKCAQNKAARRRGAEDYNNNNN
jgi:hypothetical protein